MRRSALAARVAQTPSRFPYLPQLVPRWGRIEERELGFPRSTQGASEPPPQALELLRSNHLSDLIAGHRRGIVAASALDPEGAFEADQIGRRADVLEGHLPAISRGERFVNSVAC